jgi:hypothetical protein
VLSALKPACGVRVDFLPPWSQGEGPPIRILNSISETLSRALFQNIMDLTKFQSIHEPRHLFGLRCRGWEVNRIFVG